MIICFNNLKDYLTIKRSGLFDTAYYLMNNPEIRKADIDPLMHFVKYGWREGKNPSKNFDIQQYLKSNPEYLKINMNPLVHFINTGSGIGKITEGKNAKAKLASSHLNFFEKSEKILRFSNIKRAADYIRLYGLIYFLRKLHSIIFKNNIIFNLSNNKHGLIIHNSKNKILSNLNEDEIIPYEVKISIIIPTKNAGNSFEFLLKNLLNQKGIKEVEIIVVDSGSADDTLLVAKEFDVKIITIKPEEFSHSYARNKGIDNATGDYILLTVQDALPPTNLWLYELFSVIQNYDVCAVSCAEAPKQDADLFYRVISWNHYNFLGVNNHDRIMEYTGKDDYISLRKNGQISDVACLIEKKIIEKYKYRLNYAEDLDLGIRLIKENYKIAFLGSTRVIHSHNRSAFYFLKRGYVDNIFLSDIFPDFVIPNLNFQDFSKDIIFTFNFIMRIIRSKINNQIYPISILEFSNILEGLFEAAKKMEYSAIFSKMDNGSIDHDLYKFLKEITINYEIIQVGSTYSGFLINALFDFSKIAQNYLLMVYEKIDKKLSIEIIQFYEKAFALLVGANLAYCYKNRSSFGKLDMEDLHQFLKDGV